MTAPSLKITTNVLTDNAARIASLRAAIEDQKQRLAAPPGTYPPSEISALTAALASNQSKLDALTGATAPVNPLITPAPEPAPTFSTARIDIGRVGVDALKLISNPSLL